MPSLNKVMLIGNLTRDPEVRYTPKGTAVVDLGLAINRKYTTDSGEKREETTFLDVTFWGKTAETIGKYLAKGNPLLVEGRLQLDTWDDRETGQKRSKLRVVGESMQFLGSRDREAAPDRGDRDKPRGYNPKTGTAPGKDGYRRQVDRPPAPAPAPHDDDYAPF